MKSTCMRCGDGTLLEQFRTQLAEVTQELNMVREARRVDGEASLNNLNEIIRLGDQLATVTGERDRLREQQRMKFQCNECSCQSPDGLGCCGYCGADNWTALSAPAPEPKPEAPKCEKCDGTGWVEDTSGYVDFMMCQVCRMHQKKNNI